MKVTVMTTDEHILTLDVDPDESVRLVFDEPEPGVIIIKLKQTNVPEEDKYGNSTVVENTERGWRELIFQRIRGVFGFTI